ncbi:hypothetical protein [Micromonospora halophytica]|uniref:LPXTG-motif cell wall anchor domain-containing protein n=1 Tax=Micromonospora halophytica TaxID=47864 RepID=A0A1C5HGH4_9ACTN|nr:hypothetical protein [Micromonospora halophytica]SCG44611.1 hypothetical protein GA0070560_10472 [Micromonospora halophytica]
MRLSRIITALTVGLAVAAAPAAAFAAPKPPPDYPPKPPSLTLNRTAVCLGEKVVLKGSGFGDKETVDIKVSVAPLAAAVTGTATARRSDGGTVAMAPVAYPYPGSKHLTAYTNAAGQFTVTYRPSEVGHLTFTAEGRTSGETASATLTVRSCKKPPHHLPVTGDSLGTPLKVGGGLVGAGAVLMLGSVLWRRRNRFGTGSAS